MKTIDKINLQIQRVLDVFLGAASVVMLAVNLAQVLGGGTEHLYVCVDHLPGAVCSL